MARGAQIDANVLEPVDTAAAVSGGSPGSFLRPRGEANRLGHLGAVLGMGGLECVEAVEDLRRCSREVGVALSLTPASRTPGRAREQQPGEEPVLAVLTAECAL